MAEANFSNSNLFFEVMGEYTQPNPNNLKAREMSTYKAENAFPPAQITFTPQFHPPKKTGLSYICAYFFKT